MGKRSNRSRKRNRNVKKQTIQSPSELYKENDFQGAINILEKQMAQNPTDEQKRLLAECFYKQKEYEKTVDVLTRINSKTAKDFQLRGICEYFVNKFCEAVLSFESSISTEEQPYTIYLLALAKAEGKNDYELDSKIKDEILELLKKSTKSGGVPLFGFLWYERLLKGYEFEDILKRVEILESALRFYPESEEVRVKLARWFVWRLDKPETALEILEPLLEKNTEDSKVWMFAFYAKEKNNLTDAIAYLQKIRTTDEKSESSLELIKGQAFLNLESFDYALASYTKVVEIDFRLTKILGLFGRAVTNIKQANFAEAIEDISQSAQQILEDDLYLSHSDPILIEGEHYSYEYLNQIEEIVDYLDTHVRIEGNQYGKEFGAFLYLLYKLKSESDYEEEANVQELLLKAKEYYDHPKINESLCSILIQQNNWYAAVETHLQVCEQCFNREDFSHEETSFAYEFEEISLKSNERKRINKLVYGYFTRNPEKLFLQNTLKPFYINFWRSILIQDSKSDFIVAVTNTFIENGLSDSNILWDNAFHLANLGRNNDAELKYRELLTLNPNNSSAKHNLSILVESKGNLEEALKLSREAIALFPDKILYQDRLNSLEEKIRKTQIIKIDSSQRQTKKTEKNGRKSIGKGLRFEVYKRDSFTCQYCGRKAPDVILVLDHIHPVSKGGENDILNLITSCDDCNSGKSNKLLSENSVLEKQRKQLEKLQERKEQIKMMVEWQRGLKGLDDHLIEQLSEYWNELISPYNVNENGKSTLKKLLKRFNLEELMEAMRVATNQYLIYENDEPTQKSVENAMMKLGGICSVTKQEKEKPFLKDLYYIRGILKNRLAYVNYSQAMSLLESAVQLGVDTEILKRISIEAKNWTNWRLAMEDLILTLKSD